MRTVHSSRGLEKELLESKKAEKSMQDALNTLMLICASLASMAFGVMVAYGYAAPVSPFCVFMLVPSLWVLPQSACSAKRISRPLPKKLLRSLPLLARGFTI